MTANSYFSTRKKDVNISCSGCLAFFNNMYYYIRISGPMAKRSNATVCKTVIRGFKSHSDLKTSSPKRRALKFKGETYFNHNQS